MNIASNSEDIIYDSVRIFYPLSDEILLSRSFEAHEKMIDALHLLRRYLVGNNVHASVYLHSIRIYYSCSSASMFRERRLLRQCQCKFDRKFRFTHASGTADSDERPQAGLHMLHSFSHTISCGHRVIGRLRR